jgi:hypothetical protein
LIYGFNGIKILPYNINYRTITVAAVKSDDFTKIGIDSSVDLYFILGELIIAVEVLKEVRT